MTQHETIKQELLKGRVLSNRDIEVRLMCNFPTKPRKRAISELVKAGYRIDPKGYPRINPNTGKDYKVWYIKGE